MQLPLEITFRNLGRSEAIEKAVRKRADKLGRFCEDIISCRVAVEAPHKHHYKGKLYHVRIDLKVPEREIAVSRSPDDQKAHQDVYVAIRDAFDAAERQLEAYAEKRRGNVKTHEMPPHGRIVALHPEEDYGTIASADGREVTFHRNSVMGAEFGELKVGDTVRFSEQPSEEGPRATSVHPISGLQAMGP
jgi:ribosomal subunit interface protein